MSDDDEYKWITPNRYGRPRFTIAVLRICSAQTNQFSLNDIAAEQAKFKEGDSVRVGFNEQTNSVEISRTDDLACFHLRSYGGGSYGLAIHSKVLGDKFRFAAGKTYRVSSISDGVVRVQLTSDNAVD